MRFVALSGLFITACFPTLDVAPPTPELPVPKVAPAGLHRGGDGLDLYPIAARPSWRVAQHDVFGTVIGTGDGLFRLNQNGLESVHEGEDLALVEEGAVHAIQADDDHLWVGADAGLLVYAGRLEPSPISEMLDHRPVRGLARHDGALWICTDTGLWTFEDQHLNRAMGLGGCLGLATSDALLVLRSASGEPILLQRQDGALQRQDLAGPPNLRHVVADTDGSLFALQGGRLKARVMVEGAWRWRAVAFDGEQEVQDVAALAADRQGFWLLRPGQLGRWLGAELTLYEMPPNLAGSVTLLAGGDETVWVLGPAAMAKLGGEPAAPVTFCDDIEPMYLADCARCHHGDDGATASDLSQLEQWRDKADTIYQLLRARAMPKDTQGELTAGSLYMVQRWMEGGMIACGN